MNNRFGLKDIFLFLLIGLLGLVVLLRMVQADRQWSKTIGVLERLNGLETQVSRVESKFESQTAAISAEIAGVRGALDRGIAVAATTATATTTPARDPSAPASSYAGGRDTSWGRPGVPIVWQPAVEFQRDPTRSAGFQPGGIFTEIFEAQPKVLTPYTSPDVYARRMQEVVLESLGTLNPQTLTVEGQLAEAWQVDPDGMWMRARLWPNVRFSDGTPMTSEDIRYTFHDFVMNEQVDAERTRSIIRDSIKSVTVIDARTVEFAFQQRLFTNVDNALSLFILPKHFYSKFSPAEINKATGLLMGSGPFRLKGLSAERQWSPPAAIELERSEQYWGPKPALAGLRFSAINEELARLNAFSNGEADMILPSSPQFVSKLEDPDWKSRAQFLNWVNMRSGYSFIAWNCGERNGKLTPFHDKRVRQAMTMLLDREAMIRDIWKGIGLVAKGNQPIGSPGENKDIKPWPYDPKRAMELLKSAGWADRAGNGILTDEGGNELAFEYSFAGGSEIAERLARFVKDAMATAGIRVTLRSADWSIYQDFMKKRDFDAITLGWGANAPESDPRQIFHSESIKNQGDNFAQWSSPEADRLIDEGRRELDPVKRAAIWRQLETVLHEGQPYTFVRNPPWLRFVNPKIGNVTTYPSGLMPQEFFRGAGPFTPTPGL
jgi:peptide/nickel transport system substrate-binding protein